MDLTTSTSDGNTIVFDAFVYEFYGMTLYDCVETWLNEHPEATTTVEDGSLTEAKFSESLKEAVLTQKGSALSLNRIASLIKTSDRYSGEDPTNYWYPQITCTDGVSGYVVAFISAVSGQGNNDKVTLRRYDNNHVLQKTATVAVNHCNDMTYYNGKIYATNYGGQSQYSSPTSVAVIDYSTLALIEYIDFPNSLSMIDYHDGYFYTSNAHNLIKYDTSFTEISRATLDEPVNRTGAHFGLTVTDNFAYICNGYPNSIEKYHINGNLETVYNIGYLNGDFTVGEGEGLFYSESLGGYVYTAGAYAGFLTPSVYTQHFLIDFDSNTVDGIKSDAHRTYSSYTVLNVDATNTDANPDGSSTNPYREINEALFNAVGALTSVRINVNAGTYQSISTMLNDKGIDIIGADADTVIIKGANLSFGGKVRIQKATITAPDALANFNNRAIVADNCDLTLNNVKFDCSACDNALYLNISRFYGSNLTFGTNNSYNVNANGSDVTIANATYTQAVPLYLNVCRCIKPNDMPFYNNSINYDWMPIVYTLPTPTGDSGDVTLPAWIETFLAEKKCRKIGVVIYIDGTYRQIMYAPAGSGYVGGTLFDPSDLTKLYSIQIDIDPKLHISTNGYFDLANGNAWVTSTNAKVSGVVIE